MSDTEGASDWWLSWDPELPQSFEFGEQLRRDVPRWIRTAGADELQCLAHLLMWALDAERELERMCGEAADRGDLVTVDALLRRLLYGIRDAEGGGASYVEVRREEERWYRRAAEAGSGPAILYLAGLLRRQGRSEEALQWLRVGCEAGHPAAMVALAEADARAGRPDEAELLLRSAIEAGSADAAVPLAEVLHERGRDAEADEVLRESLADGCGNAEAIMLLLAEYQPDPAAAERWLRAAVDDGSARAMVQLAEVLDHRDGDADTDTDAEAEQLLRTALDAGWLAARRPLADNLARQGRTAEAEALYARDREFRPGGPAHDWGVVVTTATITAAVVPFIQTLAGRAAEESYAAARKLIRQLLRRHGRRRREPAPGTGPVLLVVDPDTGVVVHLPPDIPDNALRALAQADLAPPTDATRSVHLTWNIRANRWERTSADADDPPT